MWGWVVVRLCLADHPGRLPSGPFHPSPPLKHGHPTLHPALHPTLHPQLRRAKERAAAEQEARDAAARGQLAFLGGLAAHGVDVGAYLCAAAERPPDRVLKVRASGWMGSGWMGSVAHVHTCVRL